MADTLKVLGQAQFTGTPGTPAALYTVPALTSAIVSSVVVCNTDTSPRTFRVSVAVAGAANATSQYIAYDVPIRAKETITLTLGISLATTDVVRYDADVASKVNFHLFGVEVT